MYSCGHLYTLQFSRPPPPLATTNWPTHPTRGLDLPRESWGIRKILFAILFCCLFIVLNVIIPSDITYKIYTHRSARIGVHEFTHVRFIIRRWVPPLVRCRGCRAGVPTNITIVPRHSHIECTLAAVSFLLLLEYK